MTPRSGDIMRDAIGLLTVARHNDDGAVALLVEALEQLKPRDDETLRERLERLSLLIVAMTTVAAEALDELGRSHPELVDQMIQRMALKAAEGIDG